MSSESEVREDAPQCQDSKPEIRILNSRPRRRSNLFLIAGLIIVAALAYAWMVRVALRPPNTNVRAVVNQNAASLLLDRLWIDRVPQRDTDRFNLYVFMSEEQMGLNDQAQSIYRHLLEIFLYDANSREIRFHFPHDSRAAKSAYTVERLARPERNDIDLKLTIAADPQNGNQKTEYFSSTKWNSMDRSTWPAMLRNVPQFPLHVTPAHS